MKQQSRPEVRVVLVIAVMAILAPGAFALLALLV